MLLKRRKRPSRRSKHSYIKRGTVLCGIVLCVFLLISSGFSPFPRLSYPAVGSEPPTLIADTLQGLQIYRSVLNVTIPGLGSVTNEPGLTSSVLLKKTMLALVDIDPVDPKTFIANHITGMDDVSLTATPVSSNPKADAPPDIFPALLPVNDGLSYIEGGDVAQGIIIYHAHTTESFVPSSGERFTKDLTQTVAALGQELKNILEGNYGIPVLHDKTIHDEVRSSAYRKARVTAAELIDANSGAKIVVDLHRDGVPRSSTTTTLDGEDVGKILLVVGSGHSNWQENLQVAKAVHNTLEKYAPGLSRGIKQRSLVYNQDLHIGALLIEVGGHENSLDEARATLPYLAKALAEIMYQLP